MTVKQMKKSKCQQEEGHIKLQMMGKGRKTIQLYTQSETLQFHCDSSLDFQVSPWTFIIIIIIIINSSLKLALAVSIGFVVQGVHVSMQSKNCENPERVSTVQQATKAATLR